MCVDNEWGQCDMLLAVGPGVCAVCCQSLLCCRSWPFQFRLPDGADGRQANPDIGSLCDVSARWCPKIAEELLRIGLQCVESNPEERPTVEDLLHSLQVLGRIGCVCARACVTSSKLHEHAPSP